MLSPVVADVHIAEVSSISLDTWATRLRHLSRFWDFCAENGLDQKVCYLSIAAYLTHLSSVGQSRTTLSSAKCHLLASFGLYDTPQVSKEDLVRLSHLLKGLRQRDSRQTRHTVPLGVDHIPRMWQ